MHSNHPDVNVTNDVAETYFRFSKICWMEEYPESLTNQNRCFILQFIDILKL